MRGETGPTDTHGQSTAVVMRGETGPTDTHGQSTALGLRDECIRSGSVLELMKAQADVFKAHATETTELKVALAKMEYQLALEKQKYEFDVAKLQMKFAAEREKAELVALREEKRKRESSSPDEPSEKRMREAPNGLGLLGSIAVRAASATFGGPAAVTGW
mmetsp:Transcript_23263/g.74746  ORF Transcript_23263/g.74746 Transcript_23263/m.74746 type:complete len:161 (-) Transcript_23263:180-662(-)